MKVYTDADYVGFVVGRRSISGYWMFLGGKLVAWKSEKQNMAVRSSAKVEFHVIGKCVWNVNYYGWKLYLMNSRFSIKPLWSSFMTVKSTISIAHNIKHDMLW